MKKTISIILSIMFVLVLITEQVVNAAQTSTVDWPEYATNNFRTRHVEDDTLNPPIKFKGKFQIGYSISQTIAVGDYFYAVAAVPNSNNLFNLPSGTYFYKIPVDFPFFKASDSNATIREKLISKGASWVKLGSYTKTYSHPTWSKQNDMFYVASGNYIVSVKNENNVMKVVSAYNVGAEIVSPPHAFNDDTVVVGAFDESVHVVQGLKSGGTVKFTKYRLINDTDAEISGATTSLDNSSFVVPINFRYTGKAGILSKFTISYSNGKPVLSLRWVKRSPTGHGFATNPIYYNGYIYVTSRYGLVYKYDTDGNEIWKTQIPNVTLVNNSGSIDGDKLYIPIRRPGKIAAISIWNGSIQWIANQGKDINGATVDNDLTTNIDVANDTTTWKMANGGMTVFYGDTNGQLTFLSENGRRVNIALDYQTNTLERSSIKATSNNTIPPDWMVQGKGLATEPLLAKQHLVFGVNTSDSMGELWFYSVGRSEDLYVKSVKGGTYKYGSRVLTEIVVGNSKDSSSNELVGMVRLYRDNQLIGQRPINLKKGEEKKIYIDWRAVPEGKGTLKATINIPHEFEEVTFENNTKTAPYEVLKGEVEKDLCEPNERYEKAVSKIETVYTEYGSYTIYYYEYLVEQSTDPDPSKMRAGYGFDFTSYSLYVDEASENKGPKRVQATFQEAPPDYVISTPLMEKTSQKVESNAPYMEITGWNLPRVYVEKYSGKIFQNPNDPRIDKKDQLLDGGRKWYTNFETKDGVYYFKVVSSQAGKNKLKSCNTYKYEVKGTPFDDYVRRDVLPYAPFLDSGIGFNWKGKVQILKDLIPFQNRTKDESDHYTTYYLDHKGVRKIGKEKKDEYKVKDAEEFIKENKK